MSGLCLFAGGLSATLKVAAFTLAWTHSVERITWEEDWRIDDGMLVLSEARILGSGAGMDPPEGSQLVDGRWHYRVERRVPGLWLTSGSGQPEYQICAAGRCRGLTDILGGVPERGGVELTPCTP